VKKFLGLLTIGLSFTLSAQAAVINILPSSENLYVGDELALNVEISNLQQTNGPSLGVYDLRLNFDSDLFAIKSIQFGDSIKGNQLDLNGQGTLQTSDSGTNSGKGWLNLFELSFDSVEDLNNIQAGDFTLFSVIFTTLEKGTGLFSLDANSLGDAYGNNLLIDNIQNSSVNISAVSVPEPTGLVLAGLGLLALGVRRIKPTI